MADADEESTTVDRAQTSDAELRVYLPLMRQRARELGMSGADIDDVINEALILACEPGRERPPPEDVEKVKAWLLALVGWAVKTYVTRRRRRSRERLLEDPDAVLDVADGHDAVRAVNDRESLTRALERVNRDFTYVVLEHDVEGAPVPAIAATLGANCNTVYARLRRGRMELRDALDAIEPGVNPRRHRGVFFPLALGALGGPQMAAQRLRRFWARVFSFSLRMPTRFLAGLATAAAILAFAPGGYLRADAREASRIEPLPQDEAGRAEPSPTVLVVRVRSQGAMPASTIPAPRPNNAASRKQASPPSPARPPWDVSLASLAMGALWRGNASKAKTLLDQDTKARPVVIEDRARIALQSATSDKIAGP